jgi:hypothetical protein
MRIYTALACLLFMASSNAGFYKWVDENGEVHYSDRPTPNAQQVRVANSSARTSAAASDEAQEEGATDQDINDAGYQKFEIVSPSDNETIRSNEGRVNVGLLLEPALQKGHQITLSVDGKAITGGFASTQLALQQLSRGSHSLQAIIVDAQAQALIRSAAIHFHLRRELNASESPP